MWGRALHLVTLGIMRKMGRVCPGIGWGNFGGLDSNEDNFREPEQVNKMVSNFSEPKRSS